ncbi:MAG: hypothetical protein IH987_07905 [Planctomycetes bacterium]|nr:hypothetical protein [Planctomycetota bacterium]
MPVELNDKGKPKRVAIISENGLTGHHLKRFAVKVIEGFEASRRWLGAYHVVG